MRVPLVSGIYTDLAGDFRTALPRNFVPVIKPQGISEGYLRPADGIVQLGTGPGIDRGGRNWRGVCYRVMGTKLVSIAVDGAYTVLGEVGGSTQVTMNYSFDRLAVASNGNLFYWDGSTLTQVTDPDLGTVLDVVWVDGYFMTTDGVNLVVTELTDPTSVNPLKYGASEANPDPIVGLKKIRNEVYALNRYTIELFDNIGGTGFPFQRIEGAQVQRGCIGTHASTIFMDQLAFLGSGEDEAPAVWMAQNGTSSKLSNQEIDQILELYTEDQLKDTILEAKVGKHMQLLYIHLLDRTLVYDAIASIVAQEPIWYVLTSGLEELGRYRARNFVRCYDKWLCGDPLSSKHGYLTDTISSCYGEMNTWEIAAPIFYNEGKRAQIHALELVSLTGRAAPGTDPVVWTQYSTDGLLWSQEKACRAGKQGEYSKRIVWRRMGLIEHWRIQKFKGTTDMHLTIAALQLTVEPLNG